MAVALGGDGGGDAVGGCGAGGGSDGSIWRGWSSKSQGGKRIKPGEEGLEAGVAAKMKLWELQKGLPKHKADCQRQGLANGHAGMAMVHITPLEFDDC